MRPTTSIPLQRTHACRPNPTAPQRRRRAQSDERGSTSSLELMALTPMLALGVLFILWSGRGARAELITSLAAQEAAVAAALCCPDSPSPAPGNPDDDPRRELAAAAVLGTRPGLDYLCLNGPQPAAGTSEFVTEAHVDLEQPSSAAEHVRGVQIVTTHVTCETDGATAPIRGLFGSRTVHGHGAHVAVRTGTSEPADETPDDLGESEQQ